jgi:hypothetical protein
VQLVWPYSGSPNKSCMYSNSQHQAVTETSQVLAS